MKNKKLTASVTAIIFASFTLYGIACLVELDKDMIEILVNAYKYIILASLGAYQIAQTATDIKGKKDTQ